ncbi:MAG: CPBP family intramembrane glutamic endopeptidase [Pseudolabrys sp.]
MAATITLLVVLSYLLAFSTKDALTQQIVLAFSSSMIIAVLLFAVKRTGTPARRYFAFVRPPLLTVIVLVAASILIQFVGDWSTNFVGVGPKDSQWELDEYRSIQNSSLALLLFWLSALFISPLMEEMLFRGFLFRGWSASRLGPAVTIIVTSLLFALVHVQYTWHGMAVVGLIGLSFALARWQSGSIVPSLIAHCAGNAVALTAAALAV